MNDPLSRASSSRERIDQWIANTCPSQEGFQEIEKSKVSPYWLGHIHRDNEVYRLTCLFIRFLFLLLFSTRTNFSERN